MNRRELLVGVGAAAAVAVLPAAAIVQGPNLTATEIVNRALVLAGTEDFIIEGLSQQIASTLLYGNPEWSPMQFTGFVPRYPWPYEEDDIRP